jgi:hypothetical protein
MPPKQKRRPRSKLSAPVVRLQNRGKGDGYCIRAIAVGTVALTLRAEPSFTVSALRASIDYREGAAMMEHKDPCVFCGGVQSFSRSSTSFSGGENYVEYTCADCKSVYRVTNRTRESWQRSGHPLSCGKQEAAR